MEIRLQEGSRVEITCVPNSFIDEYLAEASGEYVRVYLYLLRHLRESVKVHSIADALNLTDYDIKRAFLLGKKRHFPGRHDGRSGAGDSKRGGCQTFGGRL